MTRFTCIQSQPHALILQAQPNQTLLRSEMSSGGGRQSWTSVVVIGERVGDE